MVTAPLDASYESFLGRMIPNFVEYHMAQDVMGVVCMSIDKSSAGQGMEAGMTVAKRHPFAKIVIVVDKDINVYDRTAVVFAMGSRWQPHPATTIIEKAFGIATDPSQLVEQGDQ